MLLTSQSCSLLLGSCLLLGVLTRSTGRVILTPQSSVAVPYNSTVPVQYHCEVDNGEFFFWTINSTFAQLQTNTIKQLYSRDYGITVEDDQTNNNSTLSLDVVRFSQSTLRADHGSTLVIGCRTYDTRRVDFPSQTIDVYGPLETPSDLQFSAFSETHLKLSWTGTRVPDGINVTNFVQVMNLSNPLNPEELNGTTEQFITFNETGVCSEFNLTVVSFNEELGYSGVGFTLQNIPISPDVSPISESLMTMVDLRDSYISFLIMFKPATVCSDDFPVLEYLIRLPNDTLSLQNFDQDQVEAVVNDTVIPGLTMDQAISFTMEACSIVTCRATGSFNAYTTGIQSPTVYYIESSTYVLVTCDFATGSTASGCLFNFTITSGMVDSELYNFSRDSKENSSLCDGDSRACMCLSANRFVTSYVTIEAYTLEEDGVTRSSISVPVNRMELSMDFERIEVCNPDVEMPTRPIEAGNSLNPIIGGVVGGVVGIVVAIAVVVMVIVIIVCIQRVKKSKGTGKSSRESDGETIQMKQIEKSVEIKGVEATEPDRETDGSLEDVSESKSLIGTTKFEVEARVYREGNSYRMYFYENLFQNKAAELIKSKQ